jgi:hypothetical protein
LTKTDLYPAWRRIETVDKGHLSGLGHDLRVVPVSSVLRTHALLRADRDLNEESGVPALLAALQNDVLEASRAGALDRAIDDARRVIAQLRVPLEREAAVLRDPSQASAQEEELKAARERLQNLRGPGARWGQRLNDGFSELAAAVDYQLRSAIRGTLRETAEAIDAADPASRWDEMSTALQAEVARAVGEVSNRLVEGAGEIRAELAALIRDEATAEGQQSLPGLEVGELWSGKPITRSVVRAGVGMGFGALRGAQSGVLMLGLLGNLFNLALIGPVLLGGAVVFAGKSVLDERKRLLSQRRQEAHAAVRQYVDDVQFEVGTRMRDMIRELQRTIRDDVAARLEELQRTYVETATKLESAVKQSAATRSKRLAEVDDELRALTDLDDRLGRVGVAVASAAAAAAAAPRRASPPTDAEGRGAPAATAPSTATTATAAPAAPTAMREDAVQEGPL